METARGFEPVESVIEWLIEQALGQPRLDELFAECCERQLAAGVPLQRGHIAFRMLHPLYHAVTLTWTRDGGLHSEHLPFADGPGSPQWLTSPLYHLIEKRLPLLRRRLAGDDTLADFPILKEFQQAGSTDYLAFLVPFDEPQENGIVGSWTTDRPSGFSAADLQALISIHKTLGVACRVAIKDQVARNIVTAYLGARSGEEVLHGRMQRGEGEAIRAALWYSDLRDSTALSEKLPVSEFLNALNAYFDCVVSAVLNNGGEVLTIVGDGLLAIFPAETEPASRPACASALAAAIESRSQIAVINEGRAAACEPLLDFGVALHYGSVIYGNIGGPSRLEFTVVGPAVNEVARMESLTKSLAHPVLASGDFAERLSLTWQTLGIHRLRGIAQDRRIFAPPADILLNHP